MKIDALEPFTKTGCERFVILVHWPPLPNRIDFHIGLQIEISKCVGILDMVGNCIMPALPFLLQTYSD